MAHVLWAVAGQWSRYLSPMGTAEAAEFGVQGELPSGVRTWMYLFLWLVAELARAASIPATESRLP